MDYGKYFGYTVFKVDKTMGTKKLKSRSFLSRNLVGVLAVIVIGGLGSYLLHLSSAATAWTAHYPYGSIDSCSLSGTTTTIYGWANDPEALAYNATNPPYVDIKVNSTVVHAATSTTAYHSNSIDAYIAAHFSNQPVSTDYSPRRDAYEFKATFSNLYKNVTYTVSGTVINYYPSGSPDGATDKALAVNTSGTTIGGWTTTNHFTGNVIPSACLVTPSPPSVTISASPTTVTSGGSSKITWSSQNVTSCAASGNWSGAQATNNSTGISTGPLTANATYTLTCTGPGGTASNSASVTITAPSGGGTSHTGSGSTSGSNNNSGSGGSTTHAPGTSAATVTAGTLGASLKVPADGASSLHIVYGTSQDLLINSTDESNASGSDVTAALNGLTAKTTYYFQIVRTNTIGTSTSPVANFSTQGYTLAIGFEDADGNPVSGIEGKLTTSDTAAADSNNKSAKSDSDGVMSFSGLQNGTYTVTFSYQGSEHTLDYNTDSLVAAGSPDDIAVLSDSVDLSQFSTGSGSKAASKHSSSAGGIIVIILLLLVTGFTIWFIRRRRQQALLGALGTLPYEPLPAPTTKSKAPSQPQLSPTPTHAGESLRDMVIKSMHAEAQKRQHDDQDGNSK